MDDNPTRRSTDERPVFALLTSHWLSATGASLVTIAACTWLLLLITRMGARESNPYVGILIFLVIPAVFFAGLALIPPA